MKLFFSAPLFVLLIGFNAFAQAGSIPEFRSGEVPTEAERQERSGEYARFPDFLTIDIVNQGEIIDDVADVIRGDLKFTVESFHELHVRGFDVMPEAVTRDSSSGNLVIPFVVGLNFKQNNNPAQQGTINTVGEIIYADLDGVEDVKVKIYDYSSFTERASHASGLPLTLSDFDGEFAAQVVVPILTEYLQETDGLSKVIESLSPELRQN